MKFDLNICWLLIQREDFLFKKISIYQHIQKMTAFDTVEVIFDKRDSTRNPNSIFNRDSTFIYS